MPGEDEESPSPAAGVASRVRESAMSSSASPGETPHGLPTRDPVFACRVWGRGEGEGRREGDKGNMPTETGL